MCNALAVAYPELSASVPFYGSQANSNDVPKIKSPLLLHYAELDERINKGWPEYEEALKTTIKIILLICIWAAIMDFITTLLHDMMNKMLI